MMSDIETPVADLHVGVHRLLQIVNSLSLQRDPLVCADRHLWRWYMYSIHCTYTSMIDSAIA